MYKVEKLTNASLQKQVLVLADGSQLTFTIYFVPMQLGWFITELVYNSFVLNGLRICNSPNMLYQFRNKLPFGLACFSVGNREPSLIADFASGNSQLFVLTAAEVAAYTRFLSA